MRALSRVIQIFCCLVYVSQAVMAQGVVTGKVTDANSGDPLVGATISVPGSSKGMVTNSRGDFKIEVPSKDSKLKVSYVGYVSAEVDVNGKSVVNVALKPDDAALGEVVVVGYGTIRKSDLTGSVTKLDQSNFNKGAITSVDQLIEGKAAGAQVVQNTGEPGGGMSINIRGVGSITGGTSPLYVIDGLPIDNTVLISGTGNQVVANRSPRNPLGSLNPNDIESIEVLKDASATAIYGSRGANGVILVTTKSGANGPLRVNYTGSVGVQNVVKRLDLLNAQQYMEGVNALIDAGEGSPSERVTGFKGNGTDWQDVVFQKNALTQSHDISFSWGNHNTNYLISLNHVNQNGVVKGSGYRNYGARFNLRHNTKKLKIGFSGNMSYIKDKLVPFGFDIAERGGAINAAKVSDPTLPVRDSLGDFVLSPFMTLDNAEAIITGTHMTGNRYRFFGTVYAEYFILPSLSMKINVGGDVDNEDRTIYKDRTTLLGKSLGGIGTAYTGAQTNYLIEGTLNYHKIFKNHTINAVAGVTTQKFLRRTGDVEGNNFITDATEAFNFSLADPSTITSGSSKQANKLLSYLGRVNYTYLGKYLLTVSYRIDGSSRFGEDNKFGYFPSFSVGWRVDQEKFFEPLSRTLSMFKMRASWGRTGNQEIGNNQYLVTFSSGTRTSYVLDEQFVNSLNPTRIANPDLKWETTEQWNVGIDFSLLEDRLSGSVDWFKKNTYDMLIDLPVPTSSGYTSKLVNIGSMNNDGIELMLSSNNIVKKNFSWKSNFNFSTIKNRVKDLGGIDRILSGSMSQFSDISIITPGLPIQSYYGYKVIGVWQLNEKAEAEKYGAEPGDFKFEDINHSGSITSDDRVNLGNSFPDFTWGLGNTINYKSFGLYVFLQSVEGVKMLNGNLVETYFPRGDNVRANRLAKPFLNRWTPENPTNDQPSFVGVRQFSQAVNSKTVVDASYLKIQTVRLSYQLPQKLIGTTLKSAEIYLTGQNLISFDHYNGFDPALNPNGSANFRIDWNGYPSARTYLIGVDINF